MHNPSSLYLDDLIAQLQLILAQHGNLQVWMPGGTVGISPHITVEEALLPGSTTNTLIPEKIVTIR